MAFPESVKTVVRRKSLMQCCLCKSIGVEVHHIVPQSEGGPDTQDNAAPLCPSCHETYGANPVKRKMISEARDVWYEICEHRYAPDADRVERLIGLLDGITPVLPEFREYLKRRTNSEPQEHPLSGVAVGTSSATADLTTGGDDDDQFRGSFSVPVVGELGDYSIVETPRTEPEILEALERLFDQVWYNRHWELRIAVEEGRKAIRPDIWEGALAAAAQVEAKYAGETDTLGPWSDFEWGMVNGKMSALRWVLGDDWDMLDT